MAKTKVRLDSHGMYIRINGGIFRPQPSTQAYFCGHLGFKRFNINLHPGNTVMAVFNSGTPMCRIYDPVKPKIFDLWHTHGTYFYHVDGKLKYKNSEDVWAPIPEGPLKIVLKD